MLFETLPNFALCSPSVTKKAAAIRSVLELNKESPVGEGRIVVRE